MSTPTSNTSGKDIPSVGLVPLSQYPAIIANLEGMVRQLRSVQVGDSLPIALDYSRQNGTDQVPDEVMSEVCRRLIPTIERGNETNLVLSPTAPEDHTKAWQQTDPLTGIPVGQYKIWSNTAQAWVVATPGDEDVYVPPLERFTRLVAAPGSSTLNVDFEDIKTTNYAVSLTPTTYSAGAYLPAAATMPNNNGWLLLNKSNAQITIAFYGQPNIGTDDDPVGVSWDVWIRANPTT